MQSGSPGAPMARLRGAMAGFAAAAALVVGVLPLTTAGAQNPAPRTTHITDEAGVSVPITRPAGFNMFAEADVAASGMRMTGTFGWQFPNVAGPCPWYYTFGSSRCGILVNQAGNTNETFFEFDVSGMWSLGSRRDRIAVSRAWTIGQADIQGLGVRDDGGE